MGYHLSLRPSQQRYLDENSLTIAGICDPEPVILSMTIKQLRQHGYLLSPPSDPAAADPSPMTVNTYIIDRSIVQKLYAVNVRVQPRLISLLFFWEEECQRWAKLDQEERDILDAMRGSEGVENDDLEMVLRAVMMQRTLLPSQRAERTTTAISTVPAPDGDVPNYTHDSEPPRYS